MKGTICIAAIAALIGTPALAADMAVKAPPSPPPAPVFSWTGFYVGLNVGVGLGEARADWNYFAPSGNVSEIPQRFVVLAAAHSA